MKNNKNESVEQRKKRRKKRGIGEAVKKVFLSLLLLGLAGLCAYGIMFFSRRMRTEDEEALRVVAAQVKAQEEEKAAQKEAEAKAAQEEAEKARKKAQEEVAAKAPVYAGDVALHPGYTFTESTSPITLKEGEVNSKYCLLVNLATNEILINQGAYERIYPASMTKVMTCLIAAEQIEDLDAPFTVTREMEEYCLLNECSAAGFVGGETVPVKDLFFGTILPSGGEAAVALATAAAGDQESFVKLMNKKLKALGLSETAHFKNCVGIHHKKHYCTLADLAGIMKAAIENDWAREVLGTHVYETTHTEQNPQGLVLNNWFLRRIEDYDTKGRVLCAKTGFTDQAGMCCVSYKVSDTGVPYICVTADTYSEWRCIFDHIAIYSAYAP